MGATSAPKDPVLFLKPTTSYVRNGGSVLLPPGIGEVHHEVELGKETCLSLAPEGVGPVPVGSVLTAGITGLIDVRFPVETRVYKA
ncbi:hypothetical protein AM588_10008882 [Phytophthora nicotianae]|uniref:Uncharacterized protein n=1 Tax=Phytophthora nicotianae TaxID=4792 RepID=A0A0W8D9N0_PHYNI|nr:hypothetical protein AM588_10008882 [Phytophthora nicotianae]